MRNLRRRVKKFSQSGKLCLHLHMAFDIVLLMGSAHGAVKLEKKS